MRKLIPYLLSAAVVLPLYLATPAQAQSLHDIQRLEERVNEAKQRGNWGAAQDLEVQLNMARLQYQRAHGMGEVNDRGGYNSGYYYPGNASGYYYPNNGAYYPNNGAYYPSNSSGYYNNGYYNNGYYYPGANSNDYRRQQRGYYDQRGRWHSY